MIRRSFTAQQKLKVLEYADRSMSVSAAALHFSIHPSMIYRWIQQRHALQSANKSTRKMGSGRRVAYPVEEQQLADRVDQMRSLALAVSPSNLREMMGAMTPPAFKASTGWYRGFIKRHHLSLRVATTFISKTPSRASKQALDDKIASFHEFMDRHLNDIGSIDHK